MEINTPDKERQLDELTRRERERLQSEEARNRSEGEREIDDLDAVPGPDQDLNETLENLPEEIQDADRRFGMNPETQEAEFDIFKLAALIVGIVVIILLIVAVIWIF